MNHAATTMTSFVSPGKIYTFRGFGSFSVIPENMCAYFWSLSIVKALRFAHLGLKSVTMTDA